MFQIFSFGRIGYSQWQTFYKGLNINGPPAFPHMADLFAALHPGRVCSNSAILFNTFQHNPTAF
jgi:hypothetical protein